jgi:hypothetical protein
VAGELIRLGLGIPPAHDLVAQVDCAANRVNLGGDTEENEKDHQPVDRVALRLVVNSRNVSRASYQHETHDDQVARDSTLP